MTFADKKVIERSSRVFFSGTIVSRFTGLLRDILTAYAFGSSAAIAALMVAFRFSSLLRRLFGEGALHAAFVPAYEKIRLESEKKAGEFFVQLSLLLSLFLLVLIAAIEIALGGVFSFAKLSAGSSQIIFLTMVLLPTLFFICSSAFCSSLLQCHDVFFLPAVSPSIFNFFWILGAILLHSMDVNRAVYHLAIWIIIGVIVQWVVMLPNVIYLVKNIFSFELFTSFRRLKESVNTVAKPLGLGVLGVATTQINSALDSIFARYISLEGPAYLWYAIRIQQVPLALFGIAMAGAILPPLARAYNRDEEEFLQLFDYSLSRAVGLLWPCLIALIITGPACVNLLYGRGQFSILTAYETTYCLWAYALGLVPQGLVLIIAPAFYVRNQYSRTTRASFITLFLNVFLNAFFAFVLKMPAWSVAIATALSSWFQVFYLSFYFFKDYPIKKLKGFFITSLQVFACTSLSALCAYAVTVLWNPWMISKTLLFFPRYFYKQVAIFSSQTLCYLAFLFGIAVLFNLKEILALLSYLPFVKESSSRD